jgi:hypothetical protein
MHGRQPLSLHDLYVHACLLPTSADCDLEKNMLSISVLKSANFRRTGCVNVFRFAVLTQNPSSEDVALVLIRMRSAVRCPRKLDYSCVQPVSSFRNCELLNVMRLHLHVTFQATAMTEQR